MSKIEVNKIGPQCGTTLTVGCGAGQTVAVDANTVTIGRCGGTVALASGATQSGFGRTGTVDWQTGSIKTSGFTATSGEGYFCNTTSGGFEVDLPAGSAGAIVSLQDYNNTFDSNALTITPNGSEKINGGAGSIFLSTQGEGVTLVYIDGTVGWRSVQDNDFSTVGSNFIVATGGTITTCGDFKVHTFTGPGTFCVSAISATTPANNVADYLVVAGGGSGGVADIGGAGGAGGFRMSNDLCMPAPTTSPLANPTGLTLTTSAFPITVGAGGAAPTGTPGARPTSNSGSNSIFSSITSAGGGGGGYGGPVQNAFAGGSGGGAGYTASAGNGNTPPVSPSQGNNGGTSSPSAPSYGSGGGGGAGAVGGNGTSTAGGAGGVGSFVSPVMAGSNGTPGPVGSTRYFAGGGGGAVDESTPGRAGASGGSGGGGRGYATDPNNNAVDGTTNTGGGGGGAAIGTIPTTTAGGGGSGIVIIRYKFQ